MQDQNIARIGMVKKYSISYMFIQNKRMKRQAFHGQEVLPLYIQLIHRRRSTELKSHYFDFYLRMAEVPGFSITLEDIKGMETKILDHVVQNAGDDVTIESLHKDYDFFSHDLLSSSAENFKVQMFLYFSSIGASQIGKELANSQSPIVLNDLLGDMYNVFKPDVYKGLMDDMLNRQQFYPQLYGFLQEYMQPPLYLSVFDWLTTQHIFTDFLQRTEPENAQTIVNSVNKWIAYIRR